MGADSLVQKAIAINSTKHLVHLADGRLSPSPFVFCVIYGYCMTFGEKQPALTKVCFFRDYPPYSRLLVV